MQKSLKLQSEKSYLCGQKDGGDDPDITSGALIFSTVSFADEEEKHQNSITDSFRDLCGSDAGETGGHSH